MGGPCPYQSSKYLPPLRDFAGAATGFNPDQTHLSVATILQVGEFDHSLR